MKRMKFPTFEKEAELHKKGYALVAGIDEVGRGAWAGPLVAAACVLKPEALPEHIRDSKEMTREARIGAEKTIRSSAKAVGIGIVAPFEIDLFGLTTANQLAFRRAINDMRMDCNYLLADGFLVEGSRIPCEGIIKGDQNILSIAAASIVAKVTRDNIMQEYAHEFPAYGFERHVGYGTPEHMEAIKKHGVTSIHRKLFLRSLFAGV
jgi:ribonuclease HII